MQLDQQVADRLHRMTLVAEDLASRPDIGPYEVGVLQQLVEVAGQLSGASVDRQNRERLRRYNWSSRAVDVPIPQWPLAKIKPYLTKKYE